MAGTFGSFGVALSGLRYNQVAMDVANNNVANVGTDGYVRRRVVAESATTYATNGLWSRGSEVGDGVRIGGIDRMADQLLDARARTEHGSQAWLDSRLAVLQRIEGGIGEPGTRGLSASLAEFRSSWQNLSNNPGNAAARSQVLAAAKTLTDSVHQQARNLDTEADAVRQQLAVNIGEVNVLASDLAATNHSIAAARLSGVEAGALLDQRDRLAMSLAELTGGVATIRADGGFDVAVGGVSLVNGSRAGQLEAVTGLNPDGTGTGAPITFAIRDDSGASTATTLRGQVGSLVVVVDETIPEYRAGLDAVVTQLATDLNTAHQAGYDQAGVAGAALFSFDPADPSGSLAVAITDGALVAASKVPGGGLDGGNAADLSIASTVESSYQRLVAVFGTEVASTRRLAGNQQTLTLQVDNTRESISGVSIDEEMVNLMAAQRGFEAASRVMTTLDSMLDTLINRTGLVR